MKKDVHLSLRIINVIVVKYLIPQDLMKLQQLNIKLKLTIKLIDKPL